MAISFRVAGAAVTNTVAPNPSTGAGTIASDANILWVMAKPTVGKRPSDVVITTPATWIKLGQWASGNNANGGGDSTSVLIAAYAKVGATASTAIGAITITNIAVSSAVINTYATTLATGWDWAVYDESIEETDSVGVTGFNPTGSVNLNVTTGVFLLAGFAHRLNSALTSPTLATPGATLTGATFRHNAGGTLSGSNLGYGSYDASVTAGTETSAPTFSSSTTTDGVVAYLVLKDGPAVISSAETVTVNDHVSGVPNIRTWQNGQVVRAADMNFQIRDAFNWHMGYTRPGIKVRNTTSITYAASAETKITWDSADVQVGDVWYWPGAPQVLVGEPGVYSGQVSFGAEDIGTMNNGWVIVGTLYVFRGQTIVEQIVNQAPDMATEQSFVIGGNPFSIYLRAGDYVELRVKGGWSAGGARSFSTFLDQQASLDLWWSSKWEG